MAWIEVVATIHNVLRQMNASVEIFLRAGKFMTNQEILNVRMPTHEASAYGVILDNRMLNKILYVVGNSDDMPL